jgi:PAS domain S-box-containing protein
MERGVRLLLLDSDDGRRTQTRALLEQAVPNPSITAVETPSQGMEQLRNGDFDCVISALDIADDDGLSFMENVRAHDESLPFVIFAEPQSGDVASEVYSTGLAEYVLNVQGAQAALANRIEYLVESSYSSTLEQSQPTQSQELIRERERFSDLFSNFPEPTIAYGIEESVTVFKIVNDAFEDVFGMAEEEIRGQSVNDLIVPDTNQPESEEIDDQVDSGDMVDRVVRRVAADGKRIFNLRSIPVTTPGEIDGFAIYSDITERKHRERELERYETIVQTIPMGVLTVDNDWQISNLNEPGADILGSTVEELVGEPFVSLQRDGVISEEAIETAQEVVDGLRSDAEARKKVVEVTIEPHSNVTRELEVHTSLLPAQTDFNGVVLVFHDISERKEKERQLRRQNERLEEFASIVSHDLRNPLNVAIGHLEIVQDQHESPSVDHISNALDRMETLIHETLQLAKQGQMVTETQTITLSDIVEDCWKMVDQNEATLSQTGDLRFEGDPSRVRQLFENLFRNAIEHGGTDVTIRVYYEDGAIVIADDGPGIPPEDREDVFDTGHTTSDDGTGFGLAIVEEIADAHDWEITVTESWAGGARFEITGFEES